MIPATSARATVPGRLVTVPFVGVTATVLVFFVFVGILVPTLPTYVEHELAAGELGIGLTVAAFAVAAIAARPVMSELIVRYGHRAVVVGGASLAALSGAGYGFADNLPVLLVLRGVTGVGEAAVFVAAATRISQMSPDDRQAEASSYFSVAVFSGIGFGPLIGDALLDAFGYRTVFVVAGGFAAATAVIAFVVPGFGPFGRREVPAAADELTTGDGSVVAATPRSGLARFVHPAALMPGVALAVGVGAFTAFSSFLPDHARDEGVGGSGRFFAVYSIVCLLVRVVGARLPERLGPRRALTAAFVINGAALLILAVAPAPASMWVASALVGVGTAFLYPSLMATTVARSAIAERPRAIASFTMFFEIGTASGGLVLGALAEIERVKLFV